MSVPILTDDQVNANYTLSNVKDLSASQNQMNGLSSTNSNILIGANSAGQTLNAIPDVIAIGNRTVATPTNASARDILLGKNCVVPGGAIVSTLHIGSNVAGSTMAAPVVDAGRASTHYIPIYYNGVFYRLPVSNVAP